MNTIIEKSAKSLENHLLVGVRSTVLPGTTRSMVLNPLLETHSADNIGVVFQPEFLRQSYAIHDILFPSRIIIGASDEAASEKYLSLLLPCINHKEVPTLHMSMESAEMCKYVSNSFLATKVSFIGEMATLAEVIPNVDVDDVIGGMTADPRISPSHLRPGLGYGGSCLPKDVNGLIRFGQQQGVPMNLLQAVDTVNKQTINRLLLLIGDSDESLSKKQIAVLGLAFKAGTDDTRESQSLILVRRLLELDATVSVHDPLVNTQYTLRSLRGIKVATSIESCTQDAEVTFIMTDWEEYRNAGLAKITEGMNRKFVIDGRRIFRPSEVPDDIIYRRLGTFPNDI
jgi:UDPglucose 6-dehydrogenase